MHRNRAFIETRSPRPPWHASGRRWRGLPSLNSRRPLQESRTRRCARARASADAPGGPRHRLASRRHPDRPAQDSRGRRLPRRARRRRGRAVSSVRRASRRAPARRPGCHRRHARRRDLPGDARRRGLDRPRAARRRPGRVQAPCRDGSGRSSGERPGIAADAGRSGRLSDVAADPLRRGWADRLFAFLVLQRRHGDGAVRGAAPGVCVCALAADARHRPHGRRGFLVQRDPPQSDRGVAAPRRRVVAQHQRDRRPRARHRRHGPPPHDRSDVRQRGRRRRLHGARRRPCLRPRRRDPQPALQGNGQSVRLRVLDVSAAATRGPRSGRTSSSKIGCQSVRRGQRRLG